MKFSLTKDKTMKMVCIKIVLIILKNTQINFICFSNIACSMHIKSLV